MASDSSQILAASGFQDFFEKFKAIKQNFVCQLHEAAYKGDKNLLTECLSKKESDIDKPDELGNTALHIAVEKDFVEVVDILIRNNASVNKRTNKGNRALHLCSSISVAELLVAAGASVDATNDRGETLLHFCTVGTYLPLMEYLLEHGASVNAVNIDGETVLHQLCEHAFSSEKISIMTTLLKYGSAVNLKDFSLKTPLHNASSGGIANSVRLLLEHGAVLDARDSSGHYPIHYTVNNFNYNNETYLELLSLFCPTAEKTNLADIRGRTVLLMAAETFNETVIQFIVERGGNVNQVDYFGKTALHYAAKNVRGEQVIEALINKGPDINSQDHWGQTPLHEALLHDNFTSVQTLIKNKADIRNQDITGVAPLHIACTKNETITAEYLIKCGADINVVDKNNSTPLHFAAWSDAGEIVKLLLENGANTMVKDNLGETAKMTASFKRARSAAKELNTDSNAIRSFSKLANELIDHKRICRILEENGNIRSMDMEVETNLKTILSTPFIGRGADDDEAKEVQMCVEELVQALARHISDKDPRLRCTVLHAGSSSEGTKTKAPDEFDFMFCLEELSKHIEIIFQQDDYSTIQLNVPSGTTEQGLTMEERTLREKSNQTSISISDYVRINLKETSEGSSFISIFGSTEIPCFKMFNYFGELLAGVTFGKGFPRCTKLIPFEVTTAPSVSLRWRGCRYKNLIIDLDIVPAVILPSWSDKCHKELALLTPDITKICSVAVPKMSAGQDEDLWRCSLAPVETCIFRNLQSHIRNSYIICKSLVSSEILPLINFEDYSSVRYAYKMEHGDLSMDDLDTMTFYESAEKIIPSYIIKMTFLSVIEDLARKHGTSFVYSKTISDSETDTDHTYSYETDVNASERSDLESLDNHFSQMNKAEMKLNDLNVPTGDKSDIHPEIDISSFYGPAIDMYKSLRSLDFDTNIVKEVLRRCLESISKEYVPSFFNERHNVLGERILSGDAYKVETFLRIMNLFISDNKNN